MVDGATKPRRTRRRKRKIINDSAIAPKKKRVKRKPFTSSKIESMPKRKKKKVAKPSKHQIEDVEVTDMNEPIFFDLSSHAPNTEDIANFGADKRRGFNVQNMLEDAEKSMGSIFDNLTNDNKTFGSKMDSVFQLQMLALVPTIQNLDDTMYDDRKAHAAIKLNETISHLKNSLVQKQQFELKEEIDLHHPKLQKAFSFLTEAFFYVLTEVGVDPSVKSLIINALSLKMMGFEDELTKRFKGVAFSLLEQVENPLLESLPNVKQLEAKNVRDLSATSYTSEDRADDLEIVDVIPDRE